MCQLLFYSDGKANALTKTTYKRNYLIQGFMDPNVRVHNHRGGEYGSGKADVELKQ